MNEKKITQPAPLEEVLSRSAQFAKWQENYRFVYRQMLSLCAEADQQIKENDKIDPVLKAERDKVKSQYRQLVKKLHRILPDSPARMLDFPEEDLLAMVKLMLEDPKLLVKLEIRIIVYYDELGGYWEAKARNMSSEISKLLSTEPLCRFILGKFNDWERPYCRNWYSDLYRSKNQESQKLWQNISSGIKHLVETEQILLSENQKRILSWK